MSRATVFSMILVFAGAEPVLAQDDDFARNGIYLGVNMAGAWYTQVKEDLEDDVNNLNPHPLPPPNPLDPPSYIHAIVGEPLGLGVRAGYRFHPHLAGEVQFQWYTDSDIELNNTEDTVEAFKLETWTLTGNVKGYLLTGRIQPFLLAGVGLMRFSMKDELRLGLKAKNEDFAARFGVGIDFYFTPNIVAVVEGGYVLPTGTLDGYDHVLWSVGLQYRF
jgi:opacity protein-like surface antigen